MGREILFGVGVAAAFAFLPYAVKDMPSFVAWAGVVGGLVICGLTFSPISPKFLWPTSLIVAGCLVVFAGGVLLYERAIPKPTLVSPIDYSYGLAFNGLQPSLDKNNSVNRFEIRLLLENKVDGPLKFHLEKMVTSISGFSVITQDKQAILPKGGKMTFYPSGGLSAKQYLSLNSRPTGTLEAVIVYGHPDQGFSRRSILDLHLDIFRKNVGKKNEDASMNWIITKQIEEQIVNKP